MKRLKEIKIIGKLVGTLNKEYFSFLDRDSRYGALRSTFQNYHKSVGTLMVPIYQQGFSDLRGVSISRSMGIFYERNK